MNGYCLETACNTNMASNQASPDSILCEHPRLFFLKVPQCDVQDSSPVGSSETQSPFYFSNITTSSSGPFSDRGPGKVQGEAYQLRNLSTGEVLDLRDLCEEDFPDRFSDLVERPAESVLAQWYDVSSIERKEVTERLWEACKRHDLPQVSDLLAAGADPSAHGPLCWTALHYSANQGDPDICALLILFAADVSARTSDKRTPLHLACLNGHLEAAKRSVACAASDVNARDCDGCTALHVASVRRDVTLAKLLLSHGASPWILNNDGKSALDLCPVGMQAEVFEDAEMRPLLLTTPISPARTTSAPNLYTLLQSRHPGPRSSPTIGPDHFEPLGFLGQGEFGEVFLVEHRDSHRLFAMKRIAKSGRDLSTYIKTERAVLEKLQHPFIVRLHWAFQTASHLYLVLDYCPAGDMNELIQREGRLDEDIARLFLCEIVLAVEAIHSENVIYRDLKPDNIVLDAEGHIRLTDFGLAKMNIGKAALTRSFCAPLAYSPREMRRQQGHGHSVDWYMLGCLAYEMLVGSPPFHSREPDKLFRKITNHIVKFPTFLSAEAVDLIARLLHVDPDKRLCGLEAIKAHPFFEGVDWDSVATKQRPGCTHLKMKTPQSLYGRVVYGFAREDKGEHLPGWAFSREQINVN